MSDEQRETQTFLEALNQQQARIEQLEGALGAATVRAGALELAVRCSCTKTDFDNTLPAQVGRILTAADRFADFITNSPASQEGDEEGVTSL